MEKQQRIVIGSDHAGYKLKDHIKKELRDLGIECDDVGAESLDPADDYPVYSAKVAAAVSRGDYSRGIALCGSGIGASIVANRHRGVRAALCVTPEMAKMSRLHNDANVLVMGERITPPEVAAQILRTWLSTPTEGGRHARRVELIEEVSR